MCRAEVKLRKHAKPAGLYGLHAGSFGVAAKKEFVECTPGAWSDWKVTRSTRDVAKLLLCDYGEWLLWAGYRHTPRIALRGHNIALTVHSRMCGKIVQENVANRISQR